MCSICVLGKCVYVEIKGQLCRVCCLLLHLHGFQERSKGCQTCVANILSTKLCPGQELSEDKVTRVMHMWIQSKRLRKWGYWKCFQVLR